MTATFFMASLRSFSKNASASSKGAGSLWCLEKEGLDST
jgi:hypothetical protein